MKTTDIEDELLAVETDLLRYAKRLTKDINRAEDLLQETNLKILIAHDKFEEGTNFWNWAKTIMYNSFINNVNRESRTQDIESYGNILHEFIYTPGQHDIWNETGDIYNAVNHLPREYGETMRLLIHGHKYNDIAILMNIPLGTVKSRIFQSRIILKRVLKDYME